MRTNFFYRFTSRFRSIFFEKFAYDHVWTHQSIWRHASALGPQSQDVTFGKKNSVTHFRISSFFSSLFFGTIKAPDCNFRFVESDGDANWIFDQKREKNFFFVNFFLPSSWRWRRCPRGTWGRWRGWRRPGPAAGICRGVAWSHRRRSSTGCSRWGCGPRCTWKVQSFAFTISTHVWDVLVDCTSALHMSLTNKRSTSVAATFKKCLKRDLYVGNL